MATLQIELEDLAGTSWWAGALATLASQSGNAYLRFVGLVDGHRQYKGATFPAPRTLGTLPPQEAWAPGMTRSLQDLRREIQNDGWVEAGRGTEPWAFTYERPTSRSSPRRPSHLLAGQPAGLEGPSDPGSAEARAVASGSREALSQVRRAP
jgi:hypothetical protein